MSPETTPTLPRRAFGQTGLTVSPIGLGAGQLGSIQLAEKDAERLLFTALDSGINLIDTARGYGLSEERIGRLLAGRRAEFVLSTKVGYDVPGLSDWTYDSVAGGIERALRMLRTDWLDIVHLHSCSLDILREGGVIRALEQARQAGKIRVAAYSGENEALEYAIHSGEFQSVQFSLNVCDQRCLDHTLPLASAHGLGVIAKRPLANSFWRYEERPVGNYAEPYWLRAAVMGLDPGEMGWQAFALRFSAFTPGVHSIIIGTTNPQHLQENLALLAQGPLPPAQYQAARQAFQRHDQGWVGQI